MRTNNIQLSILPVLFMALVLLPGGRELERADRISIYENWFESPYEYMFEGGGTSLIINGNAYGEYLAGVDGILLYGGMVSAMRDYNVQHGISQPVEGYAPFYDLSPISDLSGFEVKNQDNKFTRRVVPVGLIEWGADNLIPEPKETLLGFSFQEIYNVIFQRWFRMLVKTHKSLESEYSMIDESNAYFLATTQNGRNGMDYLQDKFGGKLTKYDREDNGTNQTVSMTYGFWLRRQYDGTRQACWDALSKLMKRYDKKWFKKA